MIFICSQYIQLFRELFGAVKVDKSQRCKERSRTARIVISGICIEINLIGFYLTFIWVNIKTETMYIKSYLKLMGRT